MTPSLLQILSHVESMYLVIMTMILSSFINQFQCQIIGIELQTSLMPINGEAWATYYQSAHHKIWLFSPRRWNPVIDMHCDPIVISYDIDNDIFEIQRNISNATPSFNGWVPRYYAAIGENIYLNGDTGAIDVYNINTDTTTNIHSIWFRQSCVATDGRFVFFMGGEETGSTMGSWATNAHDTTTGVWYQGKDQMHRLRRFPCEIMNGTIYTFGGNNIMSQDYISKLYVGTGADVIDNYQNNNWEAAGNLIIARQFHNSAVCDSLDSNLVYLIGGSHWTDVEYKVLDIEIYDINTEITQLASFTLKEERTNPAVMCIDQHIYIFGGVTADKTTLYTWEKSQLLTASPTEHPTIEPSVAPTSSPTSKTDEPTYTKNPSTSPSKSPSSYPSDMPSLSPTELSVSPSKHPSIPHINAILPPPSTESTVVPSYSSTVFVITEDINYSVEKKANNVDVITVVLCIIISLSSVAIAVFLYRFLKIRKQTVENKNKMAAEENSTNKVTEDAMFGNNDAEDDDDDDDDLLQAVNETIGGMFIQREDGNDNS
eukprot:1131302_1